MSMRVVVVTGLSGGGKSTSLRALEDLDWFCVDNLPLPLLGPFFDLLDAQPVKKTKVVIGIDARQGEFLGTFTAELGRLRSRGYAVEVLYLDADDDLLVRRFSETRRRHPLAGESTVHPHNHPMRSLCSCLWQVVRSRPQDGPEHWARSKERHVELAGVERDRTRAAR